MAMVKDHMKSLKRALKGEIGMSDELELIGTSMFNGQVPALWINGGFLSLKPLASWMQDL